MLGMLKPGLCPQHLASRAAMGPHGRSKSQTQGRVRFTPAGGGVLMVAVLQQREVSLVGTAPSPRDGSAGCVPLPLVIASGTYSSSSEPVHTPFAASTGE